VHWILVKQLGNEFPVGGKSPPPTTPCHNHIPSQTVASQGLNENCTVQKDNAAGKGNARGGVVGLNAGSISEWTGIIRPVCSTIDTTGPIK